ncbi:hypothetical protein FRC05_005985 [Tulasnella sp. 425]|nr:hypothetical protein FRC05_005985 [Tulasnella sp. 425]
MHNLLGVVRSNPILTSNTLVRKWATKLEGRLGLCDLPPPRVRQAKGKYLQPTMGSSQGHALHSAAEFDVPDSIENTIESLLTSLQDRDTVVRWSAAKGLARVAERLPDEYASQVLETVIGLFSVHAFDGAGGIQDLPPASEATWHGATLACAEIARRGLIGDDQLPELIDWLKRGLYFDIRKGAHSIGSNVRDAVCYVLWAMARAQSKESFKPFSLETARRLVTVSVFDREVHVRRAASAAFQEHVGRMSLFPHGIDIITKADFFAVSGRKSAFTIAAPQVAEHEEYRDFLVNHLLTVSLKHWDPTLRQPAAVALRRICEKDLLTLGPVCAAKVAGFLRSIDSNEVHGGLLALAEMADAYKQSKNPSTEIHRLKIFEYIVNTPPSVFSRYKNDLILEAACIGLANTLSKDALALSETKTPWKDIVLAGIKHRVEGVPEAAALAMRAASELFNCSAESKLFSPKVEPRQAAYEAFPKVIIELKLSLPEVVGPQLFRQIYETLIGGLLDYTADQRGDVGSWIRMACIRGLVDIALLCFDLSDRLQPLEDWMPPSLFEKAISGTLKQAAERLDNVRLVAIENIIRLVRRETPNTTNSERWAIKGREILQEELIDGADEMKTWADGSWLFPKLVRLLAEPAYRDDILLGFVLSIGSRGEGVTQPASSSLVHYMNTLPPAEVKTLASSILKIGQTNSVSNNIFIPVLQTFDVLIEGGLIEKLASSGSVDVVENILSLASRNVDKIKSVPRLNEAAKIVIGLLSVPPVAHKAADGLPSFLKHRFPKVRSTAAEALYLALQGMDVEFDDDVEDALLQTTWTGNEADLQAPIDQVLLGLHSGLNDVAN